MVANFDPITAAEEYKESIVGPYRGVLPDSALVNMEEQKLFHAEGSCNILKVCPVGAVSKIT
jgi:arsenite-transporting ATPase